MVRSRTGSDADEFDAFYRDTSTRLMRYAYGLTGDLGDAQDVVQEAYVRAWQQWRRLADYDSAESWVRVVAARLATDRWRRLAVRRAFLSRTPHVGAAPAPSDDTVTVVAALKELPPVLRRAMAMHYLLDMSIAEIAAETGVPVGTVKSWLSRGRAAMGSVIKPEKVGGHE